MNLAAAQRIDDPDTVQFSFKKARHSRGWTITHLIANEDGNEACGKS